MNREFSHCRRSLLLVLVTALVGPSGWAENDLQVVSISRTPLYPRYRAVYSTYTLTESSGFGPYRFTAATSLGAGQTLNTQRWPNPGDPVTYTATVRNRADEIWTGLVTALWRWDGLPLATPSYDGSLAPGEVTTFAITREWADQSHEVRFDLTVADDRESNNTLSIYSRSVPFLSYIDQSYYDNFRSTTSAYPAAQTDDLIDWINRHMARFNELFAAAGCAKRVHYDVLEVIPDNAPEPAVDRQPFGVFPFRFRADEVPYTYRESGFYNRSEDLDYGYLHELGHQLGMIDLYQLDVSPSANLVSGMGYSAVDGLMRGCSPFLSESSALGMHHWRDAAHGYFGQYLYGIPSTVSLRFLDLNGAPLRGAGVKVYQLCDRPDLGKVISPQIKAQGVTDQEGVFVLPNVPIDVSKAPPLPTGDVLRANPFGYVAVIGNNGVLHLRVEFEDSVEYTWFDITEANVAYYQGQVDEAVFERRLPLGGAVQRFPPSDLTEHNAADWLAWADGGAADGSYVTDDVSRRRMGQTSLRFVTDGGFDTMIRYPQTFKARWDSTGVESLQFWCFALNPHLGFQNGSPWIRLKDAEGQYAQYQFYENGSPTDLLNSARNAWVRLTIPLKAPADTRDGWRQTRFGTPDFRRIEVLEIHADTWDYGFTLWIDGLQWLPPPRPRASLTLMEGDVVMSWAASHPALLLEAATRVDGPFLPTDYTPLETDDVVSVWVLPDSPEGYFRLRVP